MHIRLADHQDADLLADLNLEVHALHVAGAPHVFKPGNHAEARAVFDQLLAWADTYIHIGFEDAEPVGYMVAVIQVRPPNAFNHERRVLYVDQLAVRPAYHRRGYGAAFIQAATELAQAHGLARLELDTWYFNHNAQAFFAAQGFTPARIRMAKLL